MRIFEIDCATVASSVKVTTFKLKSGDVSIPVISVGEEGRGRKKDFVPIELLPKNYKDWEAGKPVTVKFVELTSTKAGKPKLKEIDSDLSSDKCVVVFRTMIGFRGGNSHTGDRENGSTTGNLQFKPFPAIQKLACGIIAQGDAGGMGSGEQLIAVMPSNTVFRTGYSGRLYDKPAAHYYRFDGSQIQVATWAEREITEIF